MTALDGRRQKGLFIAPFACRNTITMTTSYRNDVGQILLAFSHLVKNVRKPVIVLPSSIMNNSAITSAEEEKWQEEIADVEQLMTGKWGIEGIRTEYGDLEKFIRKKRNVLVFSTGFASRAVFERMFGTVATLHRQDLKQFENEYPYMDYLGPGINPRYRSACRNWHCGCEDSYVEVEMPPGDLVAGDEWDWYAERMEMGDGPCGVLRARRYPPD